MQISNELFLDTVIRLEALTLNYCNVSLAKDKFFFSLSLVIIMRGREQQPNTQTKRRESCRQEAHQTASGQIRLTSSANPRRRGGARRRRPRATPAGCRDRSATGRCAGLRTAAAATAAACPPPPCGPSPPIQPQADLTASPPEPTAPARRWGEPRAERLSTRPGRAGQGRRYK
jgi:hypothetical protein